MYRVRPLGVTLLGVLALLLGILYLIGAMGSFLVLGLPLSELEGEIPQFIIDNADIIFTTMGAILLIFAVISFLLAYGFFKGRPWSWILGIVLGILSIISSVVNLLIYQTTSNLVSTIVTIIIVALFLFYLTRPSVKGFFRPA